METVALAECSQTIQTRAHERKTILVVEDEEFVCDVTCDVLKHSGYLVFRAENAATAKQIFSDHAAQIDLLLCDAVLPDGDGTTLAQSFCRQSPPLKLIVASGYPRSEFAELGHDETTVEFLTKPYSSATLIARIRRLLNQGVQGPHAIGCRER